jgi:hypothetical protein
MLLKQVWPHAGRSDSPGIAVVVVDGPVDGLVEVVLGAVEEAEVALELEEELVAEELHFPY